MVHEHALKVSDDVPGEECRCGFSGPKSDVLDHISEHTAQLEDVQTDGGVSAKGKGVAVSIQECRKMRQQSEDGAPHSAIAESLGRAKCTVQKHIALRCDHGGRVVESREIECPFCGETVGQLPGHLPCPEAP